MVSHINAMSQHAAEMDRQVEMRHQEIKQNAVDRKIQIQQDDQRNKAQYEAEQRIAADRARFNKEYAATKAKIAEGQRIVAQKDAAWKRNQAAQTQNVNTKLK